MTPTQKLLEALRDHGHEPKTSGKGWTCRCPAHEDRNPSLSISTGDDGRALIMCHAGCMFEAICCAINLKPCDLMPDNATNLPRRTPRRRGDGDTTPRHTSAKGGSVTVTSVTASDSAFSTAREAVAALERGLGKRSAEWVYHDAADEPVGLVVRWNKPEGKDIRPVSRLADGSGWVIRAMPDPRPPYGLAELRARPDARVLIVEGEKSAEAARACGFVATTNAGGSNTAHQTDWSALAGRDVVVIPDHDKPGRKWAAIMVELAHKACARSVRVVRLTDHWPELPKGGDLADVLEIEGGDGAEARWKVENLIDAAEPEAAPTPSGPVRFVHFPVEVLPEPIRSYVVDGARAIGCDPSFVALPMLSALASAIGNTRKLKLKRSWTEPAIIWTVIVGESGTIKSPALELALRPVRKRQLQAMKDHAQKLRAWETDHARWEVEHAKWKKAAMKPGEAGDPPQRPEKPTCPRTWTDDTTTEALVAKLQENPRGLLMVRDELSGWFNFDRYAGGKGGGDAAKWLEVFGGRTLIVDRKTSDTIYVPRASVSIAGGIQPETLRRALGHEHFANGLAARLLFAMPPRTPKRWTEDDIDERTEAAVDLVFTWLYALEPDIDEDGEPAPRLVPVSPEGKRVWIRFVNEHGADQAERVGDEAAAWSKLEGYAARFALVIHQVRAAAGDPTLADPEVVDEASIAAGVKLVRWFVGEAERVYANLTASDEDRERARLVEWIRGKGGSVTVRDLMRGPSRYKNNREKAEAALEELVEAGIGRWVSVNHGSKGGHPTRRFQLNPNHGDSGDLPNTDDGWGVL